MRDPPPRSNITQRPDEMASSGFRSQEDPSLAGLFEMIRAPLASMQDLLTVHDEEYVTKYEPS